MTLARAHDPFSPQAKAGPPLWWNWRESAAGLYDIVGAEKGDALGEVVQRLNAEGGAAAVSEFFAPLDGKTQDEIRDLVDGMLTPDPLDRMWDVLGDTPLAQRVHAAVHEVSAEERAALAAVLENAPDDDIVALVDYWLEDLGNGDDLAEVLAGTVPEVEAWADEHTDRIPALIEAERAGKDRTTLLTALEHRAARDS